MSLPDKLREYIKESGVSHKETQESYVFCCPKCGKKDKLWMYKKSGFFQCFYCKEKDNFQGKPEYALCELLSIDIDTVKNAIYDKIIEDNPMFLNLDIKNPFEDEEEVVKNQPFQDLAIFNYPPDYYSIKHRFSDRGSKYLESRGINSEVAAFYRIMYRPSTQRVSFPVYYKEKLYGWQDRIVVSNVYYDENGDKKESPKTLTVKGLNKDKVLMFADNLTGAKQAILCEGPIDAIKCHYCTDDSSPAGNVATMGKAVSDTQLDIIESLGIKKVYIGLDPDASYEVQALCHRLLDRNITPYRIDIPDKYKDIGEMSFSEVKQAYLMASEINSSTMVTYFNPDILKKRI
jgi:hypothetical protein